MYSVQSGSRQYFQLFFLFTTHWTVTVIVSIPSLEICLCFFCLLNKYWFIDWFTCNDSWMHFVFQLLSLKVFWILGHAVASLGLVSPGAVIAVPNNFPGNDLSFTFFKKTFIYPGKFLMTVFNFSHKNRLILLYSPNFVTFHTENLIYSPKIIFWNYDTFPKQFLLIFGLGVTPTDGVTRGGLPSPLDATVAMCPK